MNILPSSFFTPVASSQAISGQPTQLLQQSQQADQDTSFGSAFKLDLSPVALAALNGDNSGSASPQAAAPAPSASVYSNLALTYSAGNTGAMSTNNGFFDQSLMHLSSTSSSGTGTTSDSSGKDNGSANAAPANASDATQGTGNTGVTQPHHGHHHHHGSDTGNSQDPLAQLLGGSSGSSGDNSDSLLSSLV